MAKLLKYYKSTEKFKRHGENSILIRGIILKDLEYALDWDDEEGKGGGGVEVEGGWIVAFVEEAIAEEKGIKINKNSTPYVIQ